MQKTNLRTLWKAFLPVFAGVWLLLFLPVSMPAAEAVRTLSSVNEATRSSTSTGLVDWWQVDTRAGKVISLFGYNNGSQQFLQVFDSGAGPTNIVAGFSATADTFTNTTHGLAPGQPLQLTGTVAGLSAGIYYASPLDADRFYLYDTKAHAIAQAATGKQDLTGSSASATLNKLPVHTFAIGAADNYSCIVPNTGIGYSKGLVIAVSTTAATYTAGSKDVTILVTVGGP